jgi:hypothetical protein
MMGNDQDHASNNVTEYYKVKLWVGVTWGRRQFYAEESAKCRVSNIAASTNTEALADQEVFCRYEFIRSGAAMKGPWRLTG